MVLIFIKRWTYLLKRIERNNELEEEEEDIK